MPKVLNKRVHGVPPGAIMVDRSSKYGNPWPITASMTRDVVCDLYEKWAPAQPEFAQWMKELRGHDLVCHCKPLRCHADFLLRRANEPEVQ